MNSRDADRCTSVTPATDARGTTAPRVASSALGESTSTEASGRPETLFKVIASMLREALAYERDMDEETANGTPTE